MKKICNIAILIIQALTLIWIFVLQYLMKHSMTVVRTTNQLNHSWEAALSATVWKYGAGILFLVILFFCIVRICTKKADLAELFCSILCVVGIIFSQLAGDYRGYYVTLFAGFFIVLLQLLRILFVKNKKHS